MKKYESLKIIILSAMRACDDAAPKSSTLTWDRGQGFEPAPRKPTTFRRLRYVVDGGRDIEEAALILSVIQKYPELHILSLGHTPCDEEFSEIGLDFRTYIELRGAWEVIVGESKASQAAGQRHLDLRPSRKTISEDPEHGRLKSRAVKIAAGLDRTSSAPLGCESSLRNFFVTFNSALFGLIVMGPERNGRREIIRTHA